MDLVELIRGLSVRAPESPGVRVCDVTEDSRTAVPGSLFIARRGLTHDGRAHADDAVRAGAVAVLTDDPALRLGVARGAVVLVTEDVPAVGAQLAERFHGNPSSDLVLTAVTGTNGKSSVVHLVHHMLNHAGLTCGMVGTIMVDDGRERAPSPMTTPPAVEMSRTLAQMVDVGIGAAAIEASSHALDQGRVAGLEIDTAIFTNLSGDHLDYHKDMDAYARAKRRLFEALGPDAVGIVNADDPVASSMPAPTLVRCTMEDRPDADWAVTVLETTLDGLELKITGPEGLGLECRTGLIGEHQAMNALQAVVASARALELRGFARDGVMRTLRAALEVAGAPPGRLEAVHSPGADDIRVLVDFAHTDDALAHALASVRRASPEDAGLWVVVGCGGGKDTTKRPRMGRVAHELADRVVLTSDNPRSESPAEIVSQMMQGVPSGRRGGVVVQVDREKAIQHAVMRAEPGDVVVLAGKGHETTQELLGPDGVVVSRRFDDREQARLALRHRREDRAGGRSA